MIITIALAALLAGTPLAAADSLSVPQLLILGSPHLANHNRDIANIHVEDVRTSARQREVEALVARLASFRPTRVAVEWPVDSQARLDQRYAAYRAGRYVLSPDEIDQIGLRLAARLGLSQVDAVDWNRDAPGKDSDYDFIAWARAHGRERQWNDFERRGQERADAEGRLMLCTPISSWYHRLNSRAYRRSDQSLYYEIATFGDETDSPGAAWVGAWYARNLRILNNIRRIARPADRIIVIYGAGHGFLLDQQARESSAFQVMNTLGYLPVSPKDNWTECRSHK